MASGPEEESARVIGRYILFGEIAAGGMATVHFGRLNGPVGFSRTVAIKRLHPQFAKDPEFVTMFLDEARLAGRVRHPNVVPTLDVVATEGEIFLVMEYVQGESLSRLSRALRHNGLAIPPDMVTTILAGTLHGLHAAHEAKDEQGQPLNIVHRDVSPQNILVGTDGVPRVLDFGVAKAAGRLQTTREGQIKGKISYMAPEQLHGGAVSRQTDIYAAAVVLWETLSGRRLFEGDNEAMVLMRALEGKVPPVSTLVQGLSPAFDEVIARGIARDASQRWATARDMARALERCGRMASPSEVGEWVERTASEELTKRAARVAEIESVSSTQSVPKLAAALLAEAQQRANNSTSIRDVPVTTSTIPAPPPVAAHDVDSQLSSISVSRSGVPAFVMPPVYKNRKVAVGAGIAAVLLLGILGVSLVTSSGNSPPPKTAAGSPQESAKPTPIPPPEAIKPPPLVADPKAADPTPPVTQTQQPVPIVVKPRPVAPAPPRPQPVAPAPPPQPATPKTNCDPPFMIDAQGHKKYKMECMGK